MAVGQDDRGDVVEAIADLLEVRQDQVDAGLRILGEQYAAVDDQQSPLELEDRHVAADVPETAQRRHAQGVAPQLRRLVEPMGQRSEEHTSELQSRGHLVCRLLLEKKKDRT